MNVDYSPEIKKLSDYNKVIEKVSKRDAPSGFIHDKGVGTYYVNQNFNYSDKYLADNVPSISVIHNQNLNSNFIKYLKEFKKTSKELSIDKIIEDNIVQLFVAISEFFPSKVSFDITDDESIYFTIKINAFTIYIEYFLEFDENQENIFISKYSSNSCVYNWGGDFENSINILNSIAY